MWQRAIRFLALGFTGLCFLGASCQRTPTVVKVQGKQYKPQSGEYELIQEARSAKKRKDQSAETTAWETLLAKFSGSAFRSEAHTRLGILAHQQGQHQRAIGYLKQALQSELVPKERAIALHAYGSSLYAQKRYSAALKALSHAYPGLDEAQKRAALPKMIASARQTKALRHEIRWLSEQLPLLPAAEQGPAKERLLTIVQGRLSLDELQVLDAHRGDGYAFPFDHIALRLARAYCHVGQYETCQQSLEKLRAALQPTNPIYTDIQAIGRQINQLTGPINPRRIGVIYPKTGRGVGIGRWVRAAITMAKRNYPDIQLIFVDSRTIPSYAVKAVDTLVFKHRVSAIFGPVFSRCAKAAAYRAQQLGVPMMTISAKEGIPEIGSYIFRNNLTLSQMGKALARYSFMQLNHKRYGVFYPDSTFGRVQVGAFWKEIETLGGQVVSSENYPPTNDNFSDLAQLLVGRNLLQYRPGWARILSQAYSLGKIKSYLARRRLYKKLKKGFPPVLDFGAIFVPETYDQLRKIVSSLVQQDIEFKRHYPFWEKQTIEKYKQRNINVKFIQLLGTNSWYDHRILALPTVDFQNYVGTVFCVRYFAESKSQIVKQFVSDFRSQFGAQFSSLQAHPPIHVSAYTYDAMQLLLETAKSSGAKTRKAFRDALLNIRNFSGVTGSMSVHASGNVLAPIKFLVIHRQNEFRLFYQSNELIP